MQLFKLGRLMAVCLAVWWAHYPCDLLGETASFSEPNLDRWMYPFNGTPGTRTTAPLFGSLDGDPSFDQRDAQLLLGFNTASGGTTSIPTGQGSANYAISAATVTLTVAGGDFKYDPTYDARDTYVSVADGDLGRPIELYGAAFRNGYSTLSFGSNDDVPPGYEETSPFSPPGPPSAGARHVFAADIDSGGSLRDVSNNVLDGFDPLPFSVGQTSLSAGSTVPLGTTYTFALNLANADVRAYLQEALDSGVLGLVATSLSAASFGGPPTYPIFYTRDHATGAAPTLVIEWGLLGDMDGDGDRDNFDIEPFELALTDSDAYLEEYPALTNYALFGDIDGDGDFDNFDIEPFEALLTGGPGAPLAVPEPSAFVLAMIGAAAVFSDRHQRKRRTIR